MSPSDITNKDDPAYFGPVTASPQSCTDEMLKLANITSEDIVYDLGCNDGRVVITAAARKGARGVGVDCVMDCVIKSRQLAQKEGVSHLVEFQHGNIEDVDIRSATVVFMYLLPKGNRQLSEKLLRELRPGTRLITYIFKMGSDWDGYLKSVQPVSSSSSVDTTNFSKLFLYEIPAEGTRGAPEATSSSCPAVVLSTGIPTLDHWQRTPPQWIWVASNVAFGASIVSACYLVGVATRRIKQ